MMAGTVIALLSQDDEGPVEPPASSDPSETPSEEPSPEPSTSPSPQFIEIDPDDYVGQDAAAVRSEA